ncbi:MAG: aldehyde dehydrogenase family protein [Solirubrobacteraceae bacterium]
MTVTAGDARARDGGLFIAGRWRPGERSLERRNPAQPGQLIGRFAAASAADVADAYAAATDAGRAWARVPAPHRGEILTRAAGLVERRMAPIAATLALEEGKAIRDARDEVCRAAAVLRRHGTDCQHALGELFPGHVEGTLVRTVREPLGVVCAITPWNLSSAIPAGKLAAALALGNTVVWNPAVVASATAALVTAALVDAGLPAGVMNLVTGTGAETVDALLNGVGLRGVTFTGPAASRRPVELRAAERGLRTRLESGGKNPSVVLADADLDRAAGSIVRGAMLATGQQCTATRRAIVVDEVFDDLAERLIEGASKLRVGDPLEERTDLGPLASAARLRAVTEYFGLAAREGLEPACGGIASDPAEGYFVQPTVFVDVDPASRLATEEVFGPVLTVVRATDTADAVQLANATEPGQSGSIFTRDLATAIRCAGTLDAGVVYLNGESDARPDAQTATAREFFTKAKTVYIEGV